MQTETAVMKREPINISFNGGIALQDYAEVMQFAALLHKSGLAPKSLDTVEKLGIATMMCVELGRPVATGIQDLAVINGKCSIFGDAALAIVRASGLLEKFEEGSKGTPYTPEWTFFCKMKRKGFPEKTGEWSWADSIRAGHDKIGPPSPWAKYTRRMMQFKARNFIMRDEFGDVLKGIKTQEEAYDSIDMEESPNGSWGYPEPEATKPEPQAEKREPGVKGPEPSFEKEIIKPSGVDAAQVNEFVRLTAKAHNATEDTVKAEAMKEKAGFLKALIAWAKKQGQEKGSIDTKAEDPEPQAAGEEPVHESDKETEKTECATLMDECNNLKTAGFSTWFFKNKARIAECDPVTLTKIQAKWERIYPDTAYPLLQDENVDPGAPTENGNSNIWCPENDGWRKVAVCESCGKAEKCQKYQERLFENADSAG